MENNKNVMGIVVVVLTLIILGLVGFMVYDKVIKSNDNEIVNNGESDGTNNNSDENVKVEIADERYQRYLNNLKNNIASNYTDYDYNIEHNNSEGIGYIGVSLNKNYELNIKLSDKKNEKISDVVSFYVIEAGQAGFKRVYFIKSNGSIGALMVNSISGDDINYEIKDNVVSYKNIVTIISGRFGGQYSGTYGPIFIDIDGNMYSENFN